MTKRLTLHLQQNTTLERVVAILEFLNSSETDFEQLATKCQLGVNVLQKNVFPFLRNLSILDKKNPPSLTTTGKIAAGIQQSSPSMLGDFLHLLLYQLHLEKPEKRFSWAYATVVQKLWLRKEVVLSPVEKKMLVGEVIETAASKFKLSTSEIAFSDSSVTGALNWLRSLSPAVIEPQEKYENFSRRYFCAAPLLVKAVDITYKQLQRTYGVKIFLRAEVQERLCQMLILDPSGLDGALDNAKRTYDYEQGSFFNWGYEGGYGQWVMLTKSPLWNELL
ncbi:hypothetical protein [Scytonema sp. NUACC26]|uniref:hypothetical protein n=1 Tax=Scytonema sp. NUACC26 TaxID=3140176 RepID=UPI0034DC592F